MGLASVEEEQQEQVETLTENDAEALHKFKMFAVFEVFGLSFFFVAPFFVSSLSLLTLFTNPLSLSNGVTSFGRAILLTPTLMILGLAFGMVAAAEIRSGFKSLAEVKHSKFSSASTLSFVLIVGLGFYFIALILLLLGILALGSASASLSPAAVSIAGLDFLLAGAMIILGSLSIIVGGIGVVIGLWRAGDRYDQGILKVAAILQIIPYAFLLGGILAFVGAHSAENASITEE